MGVSSGPNLVSKDLALAYDFSSPRSWVSDSSTVYDLTGNNNNATVNGSPATGAANGFQLTYMEFDGTDDYLQITANDATLDFQEGQTLGFVFYHSYTSGRRNLWDQAYGGYGTWTHESGNQISYYYGSNGGNSTPYKGFNTGNIPNDQWDYVVTSRFDGGAKSYLNGVELASTSDSYTPMSTTTTNNIRIGIGYTGVYFAGNIALIHAYRRGLSDEEIQQNYDALKQRYNV